MFKKKKTVSQKIKSHARRSLSSNFSRNKKNYVTDTSAIINRFISRLIKKGLQGKLIIPNAVMAELENLANKGQESGFTGLEEVTSLHKLKNHHDIQLYFDGLRPNEMQIKFAKSGEIDAIIRDTARRNKAVLITADLVLAKTAQAYGLEVLFLRPRYKQEKKSLFSFFRRK